MQSGVVLFASVSPRLEFKTPLPMVPITAVFLLIALKACAIQWLHVVLPFVPVTPITHNFSEGKS